MIPRSMLIVIGGCIALSCAMCGWREMLFRDCLERGGGVKDCHRYAFAPGTFTDGGRP